MSNPTKGPWQVRYDDDIDDEEGRAFSWPAGIKDAATGKDVCVFEDYVEDATAELIASAPDLKAENERLKAELADAIEKRDKYKAFCDEFVFIESHGEHQ